MAEAVSVIVAGISTAITSGFVLHRWLRPKFSIKVNCWFCNQSTRVPFGNKNCWDCPHCDQYNGFREDGDYNKPIPAQHEEFFNQTPYVCRRNPNPVPFTNGFCAECNRNQQLKITAIANFVPLDEDKFEDEANDYRQYLQRVYRLCRRCEAVLRQTLGQQDSYLRPQLLNWRIQRSSNHSSTKSSIMNNAFIRKIHPPRYLTVLRIFSLICLILPAACEYFQTNDIKKLMYRFFPMYITNLVIFNFSNFNFHFDSLISLLIGLCVFVTGVLSNKSSFRTIDAFVLISLFLTLPLYSSLPLTYLKSYENYFPVVRQVSCVANLIFCSWATICSRTPRRYQPNRKPSPNFVRSKDINTNAWIQNNFSRNAQMQNNRNENTVRPTEILHNSLGAMTIGTPRKLQKTAGIFALHDYSSQQPLSLPGFLSQRSFHSDPNDLRLRRPILTPAKFQSPNIHSRHIWEVNDCWNQFKARNTSPPWNHGHRNVTNFPLVYDNNLSTANGYFSPSCPASRSGSVCGDDRASVFSEPPFRFSPNHHHQDDPLPSSTSYDNSAPIQNNGHGDKRGENGSEGTNSSRSSSSVCPVGTTTLNVTESGSCMLFWQKIVLALSVTINLILIAISSRSYLGF